MQTFSGSKAAIDQLLPTQNKQASPKKSSSKDSDEFLSMVLGAAASKASKGEAITEKDVKEIAKTIETQAKEREVIAKEAVGKIAEEISSRLDEQTKNELYENANFMQLLQVLEIISGGEKVSKFPDFSSKIAAFLSVPENVEELSKVKNVNELIDLAKKFDLGLENLTITKEDVGKLNDMFKNLGKSEFFTPALPASTINSELKNQVEQVIQATKPEQNAPKLNEVLAQIAKPATPAVKEQKPTTPAATLTADDESLDAKNLLDDELLAQKPAPVAPKVEVREAKVNLQTLLFPERQMQMSEEQMGEQGLEDSSQNDLNAMVRDIAKNAQSQMQNRVLVRETLSNFSQNLAEQIENYKSPFTRVNLTLNPLNLGEVEVTMVSRGNNLHVNMNSTTATMNLFLQNQAEFKANLVNMGFTELEMNFSDQNQKQEQGRQTYKNLGEQQGFDNEDDETSSLELVIPRYA